mmetsp:Transcript_5269/g.11027  ORF Transcript_5269/g.11027 Transcript_5269/m.11027 type:complete len:358 (-) Transcript_5269:433-1506(-)
MMGSTLPLPVLGPSMCVDMDVDACPAGTCPAAEACPAEKASRLCQENAEMVDAWPLDMMPEESDEIPDMAPKSIDAQVIPVALVNPLRPLSPAVPPDELVPTVAPGGAGIDCMATVVGGPPPPPGWRLDLAKTCLLESMVMLASEGGGNMPGAPNPTPGPIPGTAFTFDLASAKCSLRAARIRDLVSPSWRLLILCMGSPSSQTETHSPKDKGAVAFRSMVCIAPSASSSETKGVNNSTSLTSIDAELARLAMDRSDANVFPEISKRDMLEPPSPGGPRVLKSLIMLISERFWPELATATKPLERMEGGFFILWKLDRRSSRPGRCVVDDGSVPSPLRLMLIPEFRHELLLRVVSLI